MGGAFGMIGRSEEEEMGTLGDLGCKDHWIGVFDEVEWDCWM